MKVINTLLRLLAVPIDTSGAVVPTESKPGVGGKSPTAYRDGSMLGVFLTETVSYHH